MAEEPTIGGHSRRFRLVVLLSILFVLFAAILAVSAVEIPDSGTPNLGQAGDSGATGNEQGSQVNKTTTENTSDQGQEDRSENETASETEQNQPSEATGGTSSYGGVSSGGYPEQSTVGGSIELSNRPELRVQSPRPARWRLGGYGRYTGAGWERDSSPEPLRDLIEPASDEAARPQYEIQAEALRPFRSLATVWRPAFATADRDVFVTDQQGLLVGTPLETNDTYTTVTYGPPSRSEAKQSTGIAPPSVQERYTQLPADTPNRLGERTDAITSDAETPYEAAEAVERWLEQNKRYSLDANHDRANDVATEFVFEMEAGYCQYFATAMTAMLRTQDIPARYVTGYTTGERVGENTYLARGKNAHAWVEVYFDGVGWVSFDPTPAGGRVDAGRSSEPTEPQPEQNQSESENDDTDEDEEENTDDEQSESDEDDSEQPDRGPPYEISLSPEPVPGAEVTVTVEKNDTAIKGVEVSFNGEAVGTTNETGQLKAEVPYASELVVSAEPPPSQGTVAQRPMGGTSPLAGNALSAPGATARTDENSSVRYDIPTDVSITTQDVPLPGRTLAANMSINGSAVAGLTVIVDGEEVGRTNATGAFSLPVPADAPLGGSLPVEFRRGEFAATGNITVADVEITVETGFFKLPGTGADLTVTAVTDEQRIPLSAIPIQTNGNTATIATDQSGSATMTLPWSNEATATAVVGEQTVRTSVSGMLLHLGGVLAVLVGTLLVAGAWIYRNPQKLRQFRDRVVNALVTTGEWLRLIGHWLYSIGPALVRGLHRFGARVRTYLGRLRDEFTLAAILSPVAYIIARVTGFLTWLQTIPGLLRGLLSSGGSEHANDDGTGSRPTESAESPEGGGETPAYQRLLQCWQWLVRRVVRRSKTKTAVEVENQAVEHGFPRRPVRRLRRAFQDVEYGFTDPNERVDTAEESVKQLREDTEDEEQ